MPIAEGDAMLQRGRYLVEAAGHCGECHTPRNAAGGLDTRRWLAGADSPEGEGRIPNITPGGENIADWSADDIVYYLESGFTPEFDTVGGSMVAVQENIARLSVDDRRAIAAYLKALPPVDGTASEEILQQPSVWAPRSAWWKRCRGCCRCLRWTKTAPRCCSAN